jgi:hypothetical protein
VASKGFSHGHCAHHCCVAVAAENMSDFDDCQNSSKEAVEVPKNEKQPTDFAAVAREEEVSKPFCGIADCESMTEMISQTMDHLCVIGPVDSHGPSEVSTEAPTTTPSHNTDKTIESFLGMEGQVWQKRGRFLVWPASVGEEGRA